MNYSLRNLVEECPVIAAVKDEDGLENCLETDIGIVFVLFGDICSIPEIVSTPLSSSIQMRLSPQVPLEMTGGSYSFSPQTEHDRTL